jgi:hypothetical protein
MSDAISSCAESCAPNVIASPSALFKSQESSCRTGAAKADITDASIAGEEEDIAAIVQSSKQPATIAARMLADVSVHRPKLGFTMTSSFPSP